MNGRKESRGDELARTRENTLLGAEEGNELKVVDVL
jgi:hypothetical protein